MKIVFMGTPAFAVPTLQAIVESGHEVVGVITAVDKWIGRGKKRLSESAVKQYAVSQNLHVLQPPNLKNKDFVASLRALNADLQIVVAFRMLPEVVWNMPPLGTYNLHGSLLPAYRGAAPIHWAVANGEAYTGMSTFKLKHEIDTGSIAHQDVCFIPEGATTKEVHDRTMYTGAALMMHTIEEIESGEITFSIQDESKVSHAPKVYHDDSRLDFERTTSSLYHFIHGMSPFPGAWTEFEGKKLKIFRVSRAEKMKEAKTPGTIRKSDDGLLMLDCKEGSLELKKVQLEGKPKMTGSDFANGYL